jgi:hypothetical protein
LQATQATAELEQPMADFPHFVSATQRDEWDSSHQTHSVEIWKVKNSNSFVLSMNRGSRMVFGPLSAAPSSAGKIRSSERLFESRGGLRFVQAARMSFASAYFDEQRREQAEARVSCSLPSFLWTSIRKNGRLKAK